LGTTESAFNRVIERLSTGQRINKPSDDVAGLFLSKGLELESKLFQQGMRNVNDSVSLLNVVDSTLATLSQIVVRQKELAEQSASGTLTSTQRASLQTENQGLQDEYNRILDGAEFNGVKLFAFGRGQTVIQGGRSAIALDYVQRASELQYAGTGTYIDETFALEVQDMQQAGLIVKDLNGDGMDDVVAVFATAVSAAFEFKTQVNVYLGQADGTYSTSSTLSEATATTGKMTSINNIQAGFNGTNNDIDITVQYLDTVGGSEHNTTAEIDTSGDVTGFNWATNIIGDLVADANGDFNGDGVTDYVQLKGAGESITIHTQNTNTSVYEVLTQSGISVSSVSNAQSALSSLETLSAKINGSRGTAGGSLSRLGNAVGVLSAMQAESDTANSRILDADIATEVAEMTRLQIVRNASTAVMAQANQQSLLALKLLDVQ
ncbi:flagellin, partial [Oligoflexia bacterium]|nr:flagellin [Oligoflexia bacterium]